MTKHESIILIVLAFSFFASIFITTKIFQNSSDTISSDTISSDTIKSNVTKDIEAKDIDVNNPNDMNRVFEFIHYEQRARTDRRHIISVGIEVIIKQNQEIINRLGRLETVSAEKETK